MKAPRQDAHRRLTRQVVRVAVSAAEALRVLHRTAVAAAVRHRTAAVSQVVAAEEDKSL